MKLGILGTGKMATAIARGAIKAGVLSAGEMLAIGRSEKSRTAFFEATGVTAHAERPSMESLETCEAWLLAVKPMDARSALQGLGPALSGRLLISVAAGVSLETLALSAPGARVLRSMPNTPCEIGEGVTGFAPGYGVTEDDQNFFLRLFEPLGFVVRVEEAQMHSLTALSGSGPAYFFLMMEALADAGLELGLSPEIAQRLALETAAGSALLARNSEWTPGQLRQRVSSPGGTTLAALGVLEKMDFRGALLEAMKAAAARSREIETQLSGQGAATKTP